ncbi:hypothetical protein L9F63_003764, partial [Diploptera punctata]
PGCIMNSPQRQIFFELKYESLPPRSPCPITVMGGSLDGWLLRLVAAVVCLSLALFVFQAIMCNITSKIGLTEIWFPKV